jgi:hypothetical protein
VSREPAGNGVDAEPHVDASLAQLVGQVGDGVLRWATAIP